MSEKIDSTESARSKTDYFKESGTIQPPVVEGKPVYFRSEPEKTKAWLAKALVIIFGSTIGSFFLFIVVEMLFPSADKEDLKDILTLILISETGIIGTALGFYFGNQSKN